jgi:hypothetical protein
MAGQNVVIVTLIDDDAVHDEDARKVYGRSKQRRRSA